MIPKGNPFSREFAIPRAWLKLIKFAWNNLQKLGLTCQ